MVMVVPFEMGCNGQLPPAHEFSPVRLGGKRPDGTTLFSRPIVEDGHRDSLVRYCIMAMLRFTQICHSLPVSVGASFIELQRDLTVNGGLPRR